MERYDVMSYEDPNYWGCTLATISETARSAPVYAIVSCYIRYVDACTVGRNSVVSTEVPCPGPQRIATPSPASRLGP